MGKKLKLTSSEKPQRLAGKVYRSPYSRYVFFGLVICMLPLLAKAGIMPTSFLTLLGSVMIYSIVALGLNMLLGYSGMISLGTAGFMGLGAYVAGYFTSQLNAPFVVAMAIAIFAAALIGVLVGFVSLRVAGIYLAIATLCVSEILRKTFEELDTFTGGFSGMSAKYPNLFGVWQLNREWTFVLMAVILVLVMILTHNLVNGQLGRAMHAMRGSEVAAQAMGINLLKYRLIVFAIAAAYAALAGVLYIHFVKFSYPSLWVMMLSLNILAAVVIGGLRSIYGTVIGAFIVFAIPDLVLKKIPVIGDIEGLPYIFSGVLIILVIMFYPNGVVGLRYDIVRFAKWVYRKLFKKRIGKGEAING